MAIDLLALTSSARWLTVRIPMSATPLEVTQVTLPSWARGMSVSFRQADGTTDDGGWVGARGTDGAVVAAEVIVGSAAVHYPLPVPSGGMITIPLAEDAVAVRDERVVYLAALTASAFAYLSLQGQRD